MNGRLVNSPAAWEKRIAEVWSEAFASDDWIERDVNFFDAGGTSVHLLRVAAIVKQRYGVEVTGIDLFVHTTIAKLAAHVAGKIPT